jgi:hypothetical protein
MDLEDYGNLKHKHTHIHRVPVLHQQTVNTVLKDWCMGVFDDEEKCKPLNVSNFDEILNSSNDDVKMSEVYSNLLNLESLKAELQATPGTEKLKIFIRGTKLYMEISGNEREPYSGEIIYDKENNLLYSDLQVRKEDLKPFSVDKSVEESTPVVYLRINITSSGFNFNGESLEIISSDAPYQNVNNFKDELKRMKLKQILEQNRQIINTLDTTSKDIDREKIRIPDNLTPKRNIDSLEKLDKKILKELVILFFYFLIGICFGIYCIYFFFVVELK